MGICIFSFCGAEQLEPRAFCIRESRDGPKVICKCNDTFTMHTIKQTGAVWDEKGIAHAKKNVCNTKYFR